MLVTTTYLEQTAPSDLKPAKPPAEPGQVVRVEEISPEFCRFLFTAVGGDWYWIGRLSWTFQQWTEWLSRPGLETWALWLHGTPAGYLELDSEIAEDTTEVQISYFGLLPRFIGRGLGGHLLTAAITNAWSLSDRWPSVPPVTRVWVHTCTLDGEHALANYQARGLRPYRTDQHEEHHTPTPPGPWPGADRPTSVNQLHGSNG